jgi:hypothetical protein
VCLTLLKEGLDRLGGVHWTLAILGLAGWAIDKCETNLENKEGLLQLLEDVVEFVNDKILRVWNATNEMNPTSNEQWMIQVLQETAVVAFKCAVYALTLMEEHKQFWKGLLL